MKEARPDFGVWLMFLSIKSIVLYRQADKALGDARADLLGGKR